MMANSTEMVATRSRLTRRRATNQRGTTAGERRRQILVGVMLSVRFHAAEARPPQEGNEQMPDRHVIRPTKPIIT
jgi:hypothetical protein